MAKLPAVLIIPIFAACTTVSELPEEKILVAHRGASAYRPEHTLEAYRLAVEQGADFIEPDLQLTSDGILICLHDAGLERTTDVEERFPDRARTVQRGEDTVQTWFAGDFTLEEIRQLDAGSWLGDDFRGSRIATFEEAVELARGRVGVFPEVKNPEWYAERSPGIEGVLMENLRAWGLDKPGGDTPVIIQSFSEASLVRLRELGCEQPLTFLINRQAADQWLNPAGLDRIARFADGIGPDKNLLMEQPGIVAEAHQRGLTVIPYTFRSAQVPEPFANVTEEMSHYLFGMGVDGLFTDNPDLFPRSPERAGD